MNKRTRNILAIAGVISTILGILGAVPSFLAQRYGLATGASILVVGGIILLAISFAD